MAAGGKGEEAKFIATIYREKQKKKIKVKSATEGS